MSPDDASATVAQVPGNLAVTLSTPSIPDGNHLWRLAREAGSLDVNSPYSYLLWCRDFADTSVVARDGERPVGFISGYTRPGRAATLFVWQVAVAPSHRRQGLARRMLDHLADSLAPRGVVNVEATVTPSNESSTRLFTSFAEARGATVTRDVLFAEDHFPAGGAHEAEVLFHIGPLRRAATPPPGNGSAIG
ncbi:diaminobutyrate acetyltransferase [Phytomonospora endophytica]|uniref:L-2,4-diaminobutyric acid acetyltransferase n=1 Tax=Phytomonospora endophytica TaxID=714109 RepID=A0A841FAT8_9ACTN|nr:diaminobutyrate acetyltransferase [Phytomonospora endophytica]MBB6033376.1 L-2,4-diaminobutyric acid acetyltransferase [Phytomonospora endophytica]GIG70853.1 L-2,4-diaminobutyric acid acetyltransferase [Phytomonospora endophytica]